MKKKVFVGISGGVDSAVSAYLLKTATPNNYQKLFGRPTPKGFSGYDVTGVFIRTWSPDFIECSWKQDRLDAIRVCAHLDIPYLELDAEEAYKHGVAEYMIEEYRMGRTPNPDVMCNREVKFGVFWDFARAHGADYIATGHYAQIKGGALAKARDTAKDQSYFLWTLTKNDLEHVIFPVGHLNKSDIRNIAARAKLPNARKKDSQGVCFLGKLDMKEFLSHYIETEKGSVINEQGDAIGEHDGAMFYTIGERHGFTTFTHHQEPLYVVGRNMEKNQITVSATYNNVLFGKETFELEQYFFSPSDSKLFGQYRYHGEIFEVRVWEEVSLLHIAFPTPILIAPGQSVVIYDEHDTVVGGGVVL